MTCIVGLVDGERIWIGGDSLSSAGCHLYPRTPMEGKVVRRGDMLIGEAGTCRMMQLVEHALAIPEHPDGLSPYAYLVMHLAPAIRAMIAEHDGVKINDSSDGWELLLGYRGGLYSICHDLSVSHLPSYGAIGCGAMAALGSLHTTSGLRWEPQNRVTLALQAAAEHDVHVAPPFTLESVG